MPTTGKSLGTFFVAREVLLARVAAFLSDNGGVVGMAFLLFFSFQRGTSSRSKMNMHLTINSKMQKHSRAPGWRAFKYLTW